MWRCKLAAGGRDQTVGLKKGKRRRLDYISLLVILKANSSNKAVKYTSLSGTMSHKGMRRKTDCGDGLDVKTLDINQVSMYSERKGLKQASVLQTEYSQY